MASQIAQRTSSGLPLAFTASRPAASTVGHPHDRPADRLGQDPGALRIEQDRGQQHRLVAGIELAQNPAQPLQTDDVGRADRAEQQAFRGVLGERGRVEGETQDVEQHRDRRLLGQRQVLVADEDRHAGGDQRAAQGGEHGGGRADDHRHPRPGHAVEVRAAQDAGQVGRLFAGRAEQARLDGAGVVDRRPQATLLGAARAAGPRSRREAASSSAPERRDTSSAITGTAEPAPNRSSTAWIADASAPRKA